MKKKNLKTNCLRIACALLLVAVVGLIFKTLTPNVKAESNIIRVGPGAGTLKKAVEEEAREGDTLVLTAGSYTGGADKTVHINKKLTIKGDTTTPISRTIIDVPIVVNTSDKVVISNFSSSNQTVEPNFVFIKTEGKVDLEINNAYIWGILRSSSNTLPRHNAKTLEITKRAGDVTSSDIAAAENERSVITLTNCTSIKPGIHYGIYSNASNTTVNIKNSQITGRTPIMLESGSNNTVNIENSEIDGPDAIYDDKETIVIKEQNNLTMNVDNSTIKTTTPSGNPPTKTFSFSEDGAKSTNTTINIKNHSRLIDEDNEKNLSANSRIFNFRSDSTAADKNIVNIDKTSSMYISLKSVTSEVGTTRIPLTREYSTLSNASVVRISDSENNSIIKVYNNNSKIEELTEEKYTVKGDDYNFKGWFQDFDGTNYSNEYLKVGADYPNTEAQKNIDLYPKFVKVLKVTIKDVPTDGTTTDHTYYVEEGTTLKDSKDIVKIKEDLEKIKVKEGKVFRGFIIYNSNGHFEPKSEEYLLNELTMTENCQIEAIHKVEVTINGEKFYTDAGKTLADIASENKEAYDAAKQNGDLREFSRFVNTKTKETFTEEEGITSNIELESKFFYNVTIDSKTYKLEEGLLLNSSEEIKKALAEISKEVLGRKFDRFIDTEENRKIELDTYKIDKDINISSVYTITVKLVGKDGTVSYTIDANSTLESVKNDSEVLKNLDSVANNTDDGKEFAGFIISYDDSQTAKTFAKTTTEDKDELKQKILTEELEYNATIYVRQNIKITINGKDFNIESGQSLQTGILDNQDADIEGYKKAKFGGKDEDRFYKFIDEKTEKEVTEQDIFEKSTTLVSKYYVFVTIEDERLDVAGTYNLEEGTTIDDLIDQKAKDALAILRTDINTETEDLHFEKLVTSSGEEIPSKINNDITIKGVYHYDVTIVEDYDNPTYDSTVAHSVQGLKVYRGETLSSIRGKVEAALGNLKSSVNNNAKRKFYSFLEINTDKEYTDSNLEDLFNTKFNNHIYITAKIYHKVKIGDVTDYVLEGSTINESENGKLVEALEKLKNVQNKEVDKLIVNGKEYSKDEITPDMVINEYTEIAAEYKVKVSINGQDFEVKEGGSLSDLTDKANEIKAALKALRNKVEKDGYNFKGYVDSNNNVFTETTTITENTTITAKYNIKVTIQNASNSKKFEIDENQTLNDIKAKDQTNYEKATTKNDRWFFGKFRNEDDEIIDENTALTKNVILSPIFNVKVTINKKDYYLEENTKLGTEEIIEALKVFESTEKQLTGYVYGNDKKPITVNDLVNENITIEPIYSVRLTIKYGEETIGEFDLNENSSIEDSSEKELIKKALDKLTERVTNDGYNPKGYVADKKAFTTNTKLSKNTTVTVTYNIKVTIQSTSGPKEFEIDESQTLNDIKAKDQTNYEKATTKNDRWFFGKFRNEDDEIIDENTALTKNVILSPIFNVKVTINKKDYYLEENTKLGTEEIIEALKVFESTEKQLTGYVYGNDKKPITVNDLVNENITIEPIYSVRLTIKYGEETIGEFDLNENSSIEDSSEKELIKKALDKLTERVTNDGYNPKGYVADKKAFTTDTKLSKNTTVMASYNIKVTIQSASGLKEFEVESGSTLKEIKASNEELYQEVQKKANREFLYFIVDDSNNTVLKNDDSNYSFYKNSNLTAIYAVTITVDKQKYYLEEGKTLSSSDEILQALKKFERTEKRLAEFTDNNNNSLATVEELNNKTDKPITENVTIVPKYVIDIEIEADEVFKTTVPENTKLKDVGYVKPERLKRFIDAETNETVSEDTVLKKHTKLKVIRNVIVTINGNKYELESYKKFGDLEGAEKDLEALKKVPVTKKNFSHFIYYDDDKEIKLGKDTIISKDITVLPKYTIELSFVYENEGKQEEILKLELEEGKAIGDLDEKSLQTLNEKLREIEKILEKEGKYSFKFSKFVQADNTEVDIQKTNFSENTFVKAIFEYKENPSPVNPTNPENDKPNTNKDKPIKEPAPNTAVDNYWDLNNIFLSIIIIVLTCGGCLGCLKCAIRK